MSFPLNDNDVVALSDLAWEIADPEGAHEAEERTWTALVPAAWPPLTTVGQLRARLDEVVDALAPTAPAVPLRAVAAVMTYLATHPGRPGDAEATLTEALHETFGSGQLPPDVDGWLTQRRHATRTHLRAHGAPRPRRHFHSRPATLADPREAR